MVNEAVACWSRSGRASPSCHARAPGPGSGTAAAESGRSACSVSAAAGATTSVDARRMERTNADRIMPDASMPSRLVRWWGGLRDRVARAAVGRTDPPLRSSGATARERALNRLGSHPWPADLLRVLDRVSEPELRAYLVGGTVRDVILGRNPG